MAGKRKLPVLEIVIRALIVVVACTSIVLTIGLLMELKNTKREIKELEQQIEQITETN